MEQKKGNRRVRMTKRLIKTSIIEILESKPVQNITVTEICERADINRSTFYAYYDNPYDLMLSIKKDIIADTEELLHMFPGLPPRKRMPKLLELHLNYLNDHLAEFKAFSSDVGEDFSLPSETMNIILTPYFEYLEANREDVSISRTARTFCIFGTIGIVKRWVETDRHETVAELSGKIIKIIDEIILNGEQVF